MHLASVSLVLIVATAFFVSGLVKGVTGMGLQTVAMAMLGAVLTPLVAANLLIIPAFVTNVWQLLAGPGFTPLIRRLWPMMAAVVVGTILGAALIARRDVRVTTAALGLALAAYAIYSLLVRPIHTPARLEPWLGPLVGAATGMVTGATGVFVIPAVPYLQTLGLRRDDLIQALGLSFTVSTVALALGLAAHGALRTDNVVASSLAIIPAFAGMSAGTWVRRRVSPATFRLWFLIALLVLGAEMALRPLMT